MKWLFTLALIVATTFVLLLVMVRLQEHNIYYPTSYPESRLRVLPDGVEYVEFPGPDGEPLTGLFRPGDPGEPALVMAHGNAGNALDRLVWLRRGVPSPWHSLVFDYRGFGRSPGSPDEQGLYRDVVSAVDFVRARAGDGPLVLHGRSLGVPVVAHAAQTVPVDALVLESGFPSAAAVARRLMPLPGIGALLRLRFRTVEYLRTAQERHGPIRKWIVHGRRDRVIPFELGEQLYRESPEPKRRWFVSEAGHNDLLSVAGEEYRERLRAFVQGE